MIQSLAENIFEVLFMFVQVINDVRKEAIE